MQDKRVLVMDIEKKRKKGELKERRKSCESA
jgi:hypothetical protein